MGNGMNKIIPGLYVGNIRDSKDSIQLSENKITHILSIHDNAKPILPNKEYLCLAASDHAQQDLLQFIQQTNDFIHKARINGGNVLVHCLAGVSRSVTITVVYIMTVTNLNWRDALNAVRGARRCANPNFGFQRQLLSFQHDNLEQEKERLFSKFKDKKIPHDDKGELKRLLEIHHQWVLHGDAMETDDRRKEDDLYPLPLGAYGRKDAKPEQASGAQASAPSCSSQAGNLRPKSSESGKGCDDEKTTSELINEMFETDRNKAMATILSGDPELKNYVAQRKLDAASTSSPSLDECNQNKETNSPSQSSTTGAFPVTDQQNNAALDDIFNNSSVR